MDAPMEADLARDAVADYAKIGDVWPDRTDIVGMIWIRRCVAAEAEVSRLSDLLHNSIEESVKKAPMRFVEGGVEIEHWAVGVLARSFGETLGTAPNCIELGVHDEGREHDYIVTIQRRNGKSSLQLRTEAEKRATEAEAEVARLWPGASAWDAMATMLAGLEKHDGAADPTVETLLDWIDRAKKAEARVVQLETALSKGSQ